MELLFQLNFPDVRVSYPRGLPVPVPFPNILCLHALGPEIHFLQVTMTCTIAMSCTMMTLMKHGAVSATCGASCL